MRRYAAEGDANGQPISYDEEGEKALRLEREVLAYPGYTSTFRRFAMKFDRSAPSDSNHI